MALLACTNEACRSHGPFKIVEAATQNGHPHKVLACALCGSVVGILEPDHCRLPDEGGQRDDVALRRLESSLNAIQSGLTHLKSQISSLEARINRRR